MNALSLTVASVALLATGPVPAEENNTQWVKALVGHAHRLGDVHMEVVGTSGISDEYAAAYAEAFDKKPADIKRQKSTTFQASLKVRLRENRIAAYLYERTDRSAEANAKVRQHIHAWDGSRFMSIDEIPQPGERGVADVTLNQDNSEQLLGECSTLVVLGLRLPGIAGTLAAALATGEATLRAEPVGERTRLTITPADSSDQSPAPRFSFVVGADPSASLKIDEIAEDIRDGTGNWYTYRRWVIDQMLDGSDGLVLPCVWRIVESSPTGTLVAETAVTLQDFTLRASFTDKDLAYRPEDGSTVYDDKTKQASIYNGRLSERIVEDIRASGAEAREAVEETLQRQELYRVESGDSAWISRAILLGLGVLLLMFSAVWHWRSRWQNPKGCARNGESS